MGRRSASVVSGLMAAPHELSFADALSVEDLGGDRYRGRYPGWNGYPRVFGGVVLAQAVSAAAATVEAPRAVHALHGLFLRPARPGDEAELVVERLRDGRSFSARWRACSSHLWNTVSV